MFSQREKKSLQFIALGTVQEIKLPQFVFRITQFDYVQKNDEKIVPINKEYQEKEQRSRTYIQKPNNARLGDEALLQS